MQSTFPLLPKNYQSFQVVKKYEGYIIWRYLIASKKIIITFDLSDK